MDANACPCSSGKTYAECCQPIHEGKPGPTAESVMRARYSAFAKQKIDFLKDSLVPSTQKTFDRKGTTEWAATSDWLGLEVHGTEQGQPGDKEGIVDFTAKFTAQGKELAHRERALFQFDEKDGRWYYLKAISNNKPVVKEQAPGRNDPCSCGSGKKFKKCHGVAA